MLSRATTRDETVEHGGAREGLGELLDRRYGQDPHGGGLAPHEAGAKSLIARLLAHRSVRRYQSKPLPSGTLELLVAAGQSAASSANLQLWSVVSVDSPERRRALSVVAGNQAHILDCALFLVWIADLHRAGEIARARGIEVEGLSYMESFLVASIDATLAAQNAVVAAEELGLGTVYIGALRNDPERVAEILDLPSRAFALFGVCVGWPADDLPTAVKPRLPQSVVLHRDRYQFGEREQAAVADYDQLMQGHYAARAAAAPDQRWSWHSARRLANVTALNGRHVLRDVLGRLGFELK